MYEEIDNRTSGFRTGIKILVWILIRIEEFYIIKVIIESLYTRMV